MPFYQTSTFQCFVNDHLKLLQTYHHVSSPFTLAQPWLIIRTGSSSLLSLEVLLRSLGHAEVYGHYHCRLQARRNYHCVKKQTTDIWDSLCNALNMPTRWRCMVSDALEKELWYRLYRKLTGLGDRLNVLEKRKAPGGIRILVLQLVVSHNTDWKPRL
jgi:hypothetical protein